MQALVLGAAGFIGINLIDELLRERVPVRAGRRRRTNVLALRKRPVPMVQADLDKPDQLRQAMDGCDVVFHVAGHYPKHYLHPEQALQEGIRRMANVLDAAAAAGVERLVYVSSTATVSALEGQQATEDDVFPVCPELGLYHQIKWELEQMVLAENRLECITACPGACLGPWDLRVGTSALLVATARGIRPPHPDGWINAVDVRDVATALFRLGQIQHPPQRVLLVGHNLRLHPLLETLASRYDVPPPSEPLSAEAAIALADAEEARAEVEGGRAALSREIADLIVHSMPIDTSLAESTLDISWRPLRHTLDDFDNWARGIGLIPKRP